MAVAKEFDPKLLGGKYTTQQELEANPTALMDRQTALGKGFVGGDAWGDGRYDQYFKGFNQGQSSGSSPVPPQPPVDPYPPKPPFPPRPPVVDPWPPRDDPNRPLPVPRNPGDLYPQPPLRPGDTAYAQGTTAGVGNPPRNPNEVGPPPVPTPQTAPVIDPQIPMGTTPAGGITPAGNYASTYTPPSQAEIPVTPIPYGYGDSVPISQHVLSQNPGYVKPQTETVPDSIKLYDPSYIDPRTGQVSDNLLGGGEGGAYSDPNAIPPEELQRRWQLRNAGYTGEWGVGPAPAEVNYGYSFRNLTSDYTVPGDAMQIRPDLLGGQYADQATIPENVLKDRLRLRDAGYNEKWGSQLVPKFLAGTLGSDATPPTIGVAGFRDLGKNYLSDDGKTIHYKLLGGKYTDPATIPENVLRDRLRFRKAGYQEEWGAGKTNEWLIGPGEGGLPGGQEQWDAANGDPGDVILYGGVEGGVAAPPSGPVTLGEGKPTQRTTGIQATTAADVYLPTTQEREYTRKNSQQEHPNSTGV